MQRQLLIVLVAAVVSIPTGAATWFAYGTYEPDTIFDVTGGHMQINNDVTPGGKKLYFNTYQTEFGAGTSINSGTLGSRYTMAGLQNWEAVFGAWLDCNGDRHVGFAESGVVIYPARALLDKSVCPDNSLHNDGQWVYEYIPVGYQHGEVPEDPQKFVIRDEAALVWGDIGLPGAVAAGTCPISPLPHGTTAGTGWLVRYLDCFTNHRVKDTVNQNDVTPGQVLTWDCPSHVQHCRDNPQKSDSVLNQQFPQSLFGNPETGETGTLQLDSDEDGGSREYAFTTWDCSGRTVEVRDDTNTLPRDVAVPNANRPGDLDGNERLTDDDGNYAWVARPNPQVHDPTDSVADGLNQTFMGFHAGSGDINNDASFVGGDCNFEAADSDGDNTYSVVHTTAFFRADAPFEPPTAAAKKETDDNMEFFNGARNPPEVEAVLGQGTPASIVSTPPTDFVVGTAIWQANTIWVTQPQSISRTTLQPQGAAYWSWYGRVGSTTLAQGFTYTGTPGIYGAEACGTFITPSDPEHDNVRNGWNCATADWYTDANFQPIVDGNEMWQGKVGYTYQFRDIDCWDGTVARGTGVRASLADLSATGPCLDSTLPN